ncbi:hypothetical protein [Pseudorhodoferax sp.]|uniref:hypothetical protein n=1 Tax=Pseudorhodoferax sp. TaxID=1993553 RepID=UPI0039E46E57
MVHTRDVLAYLVAFKSFWAQVGPSHAVVVCDPSITADDRRVLLAHIPHLELRDADEFTHPDIPRGGVWERLFAIGHYSAKQYTLQLDADTATIGYPDEVIACISANRGYILAEHANTCIEPISASVERARTMRSQHIQVVAEMSLTSVGLPDDARYVRGCAGFSGFPQSGDMAERIVDFSRRMQRQLGDRWREWGTEQVSSNFIVANLPDAQVLPLPKYAAAHQIDANSVFIHFIGPVRFRDRLYERTAVRIARALQTNAQPLRAASAR